MCLRLHRTPSSVSPGQAESDALAKGDSVVARSGRQHTGAEPVVYLSTSQNRFWQSISRPASGAAFDCHLAVTHPSRACGGVNSDIAGHTSISDAETLPTAARPVGHGARRPRLWHHTSRRPDRAQRARPLIAGRRRDSRNSIYRSQNLTRTTRKTRQVYVIGLSRLSQTHAPAKLICRDSLEHTIPV